MKNDKKRLPSHPMDIHHKQYLWLVVGCVAVLVFGCIWT
jgi:hypothetical protein